MFVRRGLIEKCVPDSAPSNSLTPAIDAWSAWDQQSAGLTYPFVLRAIVIAPRWGLTMSADGSTIVRQRDWVAVGVGPAGTEREIARAEFGMGGYGSASGFVGGESATILAAWNELRRVAPVLIPPFTRIAVAAYRRGGAASVIQVYLVGYDARDIAYGLAPLDPARFIRGIADSYSDDVPDTSEVSVTHGLSAWGWGDWVEASASLKTGCLLSGLAVTTISDTSSNQDCQIQVGVGLGSGVQPLAMMPVPYALIVGYVSTFLEFPDDVLLKQGERVAVRTANPGTSARTKAVRLGLTRLGEGAV